MSNGSSASLAPRLLAQPSQAVAPEVAAHKETVTLSPLSADPAITGMEISPTWVAESQSSLAVAAYVVLAAMLTTFIGGAYAIVMLVRALT